MQSLFTLLSCILLLPASPTCSLRLVLLTPPFPCDPSAVPSLRSWLSQAPVDSIGCTVVIRPELESLRRDYEGRGASASASAADAPSLSDEVASYVSGFASLKASFPNLRMAVNSPTIVDAALSRGDDGLFDKALAASLLEKVDGVHFKETQLLSAPGSALGLCRERGLDVSLSTHSMHSYRRCEEVLEGEGLRPSFALAGTCYLTGSHPEKDERDCRGLELVADLADAGCDVVAIGGITPERLGEVVNRGADGVAILSGWMEDNGEWGEALTRHMETHPT